MPRQRECSYSDAEKGLVKLPPEELIICLSCGYDHFYTKKEYCPAWEKKCLRCSKKGHFYVGCDMEPWTLPPIIHQYMYSFKDIQAAVRPKRIECSILGEVYVSAIGLFDNASVMSFSFGSVEFLNSMGGDIHNLYTSNIEVFKYLRTKAFILLRLLAYFFSTFRTKSCYQCLYF
ncbi:unnamed protein product [Lepeophtheirus salmonis]|uniref:(salmon louse) hypothetical protein n=1 Tax=Lepeophtheirus salmonis TaxID=72036 RepID=A0A7R8CDJ4_LEPSM|nr:unnamed protein product [Lepeophtheirus salmonis]CAF2781639.1 unnamed protein product [Lepeophtheirus salmonis]